MRLAGWQRGRRTAYAERLRADSRRRIYRAISGKPIVSEVAMAFRRHERAPAVRAFIAHAKKLP